MFTVSRGRRVLLESANFWLGVWPLRRLAAGGGGGGGAVPRRAGRASARPLRRYDVCGYCGCGCGGCAENVIQDVLLLLRDVGIQRTYLARGRSSTWRSRCSLPKLPARRLSVPISGGRRTGRRRRRVLTVTSAGHGAESGSRPGAGPRALIAPPERGNRVAAAATFRVTAADRRRFGGRVRGVPAAARDGGPGRHMWAVASRVACAQRPTRVLARHPALPWSLLPHRRLARAVPCPSMSASRLPSGLQLGTAEGGRR